MIIFVAGTVHPETGSSGMGRILHATSRTRHPQETCQGTHSDQIKQADFVSRSLLVMLGPERVSVTLQSLVMVHSETILETFIPAGTTERLNTSANRLLQEAIQGTTRDIVTSLPTNHSTFEMLEMGLTIETNLPQGTITPSAAEAEPVTFTICRAEHSARPAILTMISISPEVGEVKRLTCTGTVLQLDLTTVIPFVTAQILGIHSTTSIAAPAQPLQRGPQAFAIRETIAAIATLMRCCPNMIIATVLDTEIPFQFVQPMRP